MARSAPSPSRSGVRTTTPDRIGRRAHLLLPLVGSAPLSAAGWSNPACRFSLWEALRSGTAGTCGHGQHSRTGHAEPLTSVSSNVDTHAQWLSKRLRVGAIKDIRSSADASISGPVSIDRGLDPDDPLAHGDGARRRHTS